MSKQPNKQIRPYTKPNSYIAPFPRHQYQIDILDMVDLQKDENQPRYGLVVIDAFSKRAEIEPLKHKDQKSIYEALLKFFKKWGTLQVYMLMMMVDLKVKLKSFLTVRVSI